jgi:4-alpha-glucanotransferase
VSPELKALAEQCGIALVYETFGGETRHVSEEALRLTLAALGHAPGRGTGGQPDRARSDAVETKLQAPKGVRCFMPQWLDHRRLWGIALQLYQLRSSRNWGIGDFLDLAQFAGRAAEFGADFVGLNPLHALFAASPDRTSPFSPSNRRFLNPIYIAPDAIPGVEPEAADAPSLKRARNADFVDYEAVAQLKRDALWRAWARWEDAAPRDGIYSRAAFERFRDSGSRALRLHALFEALSEAMVKAGHGPGWPNWPKAYHDPAGDAVRSFTERNATEIDFHAWLQWLADAQLSDAQNAARRAGMRIGLYLDLAVGEASDGSAAWIDPAVTVSGLRIGAPPDMYSDTGQDWGLAPLSPQIMRRDGAAAYGDVVGSVMRHAGAIRIDHAMGLYRLFVIPDGLAARDGVYVYLPMPAILSRVSDLSRAFRAIVIGEDLGTVPDGFRRAMTQCEIQSYRVLYFEREKSALRRPSRYPRKALACISTHDLPPLQGWWCGDDITLRQRLGHNTETTSRPQFIQRQRDRATLLEQLKRDGLFAANTPEPGENVDIDLAAAIHAHLSRAPSRLLAVRLEDLAGEREPVNVPGTSNEYPNWRRKLGLSLDRIFDSERFSRIVEAIRAQRPKS